MKAPKAYHFNESNLVSQLVEILSFETSTRYTNRKQERGLIAFTVGGAMATPIGQCVEGLMRFPDLEDHRFFLFELNHHLVHQDHVL